MINKVTNTLNNRYLVAIVVGLFVLSVVKSFSRR